MLALLPAVLLPDLLDSTEAREATVTAGVAELGSWIAPGRPDAVASKPPLLHWMGAVLVKTAGVSPLVAARTISLFSALLLLLVTARLAAELGGSSTESLRDSTAGLAAAAVLASSYLFLRLAADARVDMLFSALVGSALLFGIRGVVFERPARLPLPVFAFAGLAVLAKGPLGFVLPFLILGAILVREQGMLTAVRMVCRPVGLLLALGLPGCWYVVSGIESGGALAERQLLFENIGRFLGADGITERPWWYYIPAFVVRAAPCSLVFLLAVFRRPLSQRHRAPAGAFAPSRPAVLLVWFGLGFLFFSASVGKRHSYLLPLLPAVAAFAGIGLRDWANQMSDRGWAALGRVTKSGRLSVWILALLATGLVFGSEHIAAAFNGPGMTAEYFALRALGQRKLLVLSLCGIAVFLTACPPRGGSIGASALRIVSAMIVLLGCGLTVQRDVKSELKGYRQAADAIRARFGAGERPMLFERKNDELLDPIIYYLRDRVVVLPIGSEQKLPGFGIAAGDDFADWDVRSKFCDHVDPVVIEQFSRVEDFAAGNRERAVVLFRCPS